VKHVKCPVNYRYETEVGVAICLSVQRCWFSLSA